MANTPLGVGRITIIDPSNLPEPDGSTDYISVWNPVKTRPWQEAMVTKTLEQNVKITISKYADFHPDEAIQIAEAILAAAHEAKEKRL